MFTSLLETNATQAQAATEDLAVRFNQSQAKRSLRRYRRAQRLSNRALH